MSVLVKICGIKSAKEAKAVCEVEFNNKRVDFIGIIFAKSPRQVDFSTAKEIVKIAHQYSIKAVGVYDSHDLDSIFNHAKELNLDAVQLYTKIKDGYKKLFNECKIELWEALSVDETATQPSNMANLSLYDAKGVNLGGNGVSFEWGILKEIKAKFGIAGGLGTHNVKGALKTGAILLDFNSKLEDENMQKDPKKIYEILKIIKESI